MINFAGNAGHDIRLDPGACDPIQPWENDYTDTKEAEWCREVMLTACQKVQSKGHNAQFIQDDSLSNICALSDAFGADVFVSLHLNAATNTDAQGPETYYLDGSEEGARLANCVHGQIVQKLGAHGRDRGTRTANFYVLRNTAAPAILIEAGFITNVWEEATLHEPWVKRAVSDAIVDGVLKFMGKEA